MTRSMGERLPEEVAAALDGHDLEGGIGLTVEMVTVGDDGWPSIALLSVGEVLASDDRTIRLALWPGSHSTGNLTRTGRCLLAFVHGGAAYTVRLESCRADDLLQPALRAAFDGRIVEVRSDVVSYATLRSGMTFDLPDPETVVARWRATIDALRAHPGCRPPDV